VLGRKCSPYGRENYIQWDEANKEREGIAERFNERWYRQEWWDISADLVIATVAGETGIDITPHGFGKEQIVKNFDATKVTYFGDKTEEGGNDFEIARKLRDKGGKVIQVNSWEDTFKCLQKIQNVV
jgi:phosphomannomutase